MLSLHFAQFPGGEMVADVDVSFARMELCFHHMNFSLYRLPVQ